MIKKYLVIAAATGIFGIALSANAQLFPYTGTSTAPSSSVISATSDPSASSSATSSFTTFSTASTTMNASTAAPIVTPGTTAVSGQYLQLDGLLVVGAPGVGATEPVMITAANPTFATLTADGIPLAATGATVACTQFPTDSAPVGIGTTCPVPPIAMASTTASGTYYSPYTVNVSAATSLLLSDRTAAALANITPGDTINVYGYYGSDGTIQAEVLRDMSKPAGGSTAIGGDTTVSSTAELQTELDQLEALVAQLESEVGMNTSTMATTAMTSPSIGTSIYCPMIPAGSTSTSGCPPPGAATTSASGAPIIYH